MFSAIIITFVITTLVMTLGFVARESRKTRRAYDRSKAVTIELRKKLSDYYRDERRDIERQAYDRGLYDGRETDAIYRKMLEKHTKKEQFSLLMGGKNHKEVAP